MPTEIICNLHMHTPFSDGALYHDALAAEAARAGVDALFVTDHNVRVHGVDGWRESAGRRVLVLAGEEIHHQDRDPQKNHMLVFGTRSELSPLAPDPQTLLDAIRAEGGVAYLAHPDDPASDFIGEESLGWVDWSVTGFTGLEIWNYMSEFKGLAQNAPAAVFYAFFPSLGIYRPPATVLQKWDSLLAAGRRVAALGGSDAHGQSYSLGPLRRRIFPYEHLFRAVNTHLLLARPFTGDAAEDARLVVEALAAARGWVAYDLSAPTRGFRFRAESAAGDIADMGGEMPLGAQPMLKAALPRTARVRLIRAGAGAVFEGSCSEWEWPVAEKGAYRLEALRFFRGVWRGWIYSNPIYIV